MNHDSYRVEVTINIHDLALDEIRGCLAGLGKDLNLVEAEGANGKGRLIKVHISTDDPQLVFDACSQFGRLKAVKIEENVREGQKE